MGGGDRQGGTKKPLKAPKKETKELSEEDRAYQKKRQEEMKAIKKVREEKGLKDKK
jgi:hypothetical protein